MRASVQERRIWLALTRRNGAGNDRSRHLQPWGMRPAVTTRGETVSTTDYTVAGMTCGHCASSVTAEISNIPGVTHVKVDVTASRVTVESNQPVTDATVIEAVEEASYEVVGT